MVLVTSLYSHSVHLTVTCVRTMAGIIFIACVSGSEHSAEFGQDGFSSIISCNEVASVLIFFHPHLHCSRMCLILAANCCLSRSGVQFFGLVILFRALGL